MNEWYKKHGKRALDFLLALAGLIVLIIPMLLVAAVIACDSPGGAVYKQKRLGTDMRQFFVYKFRTMVSNADRIGGTTTYENDSRITTVGAFLRKYSIDELPQLVNILRGEMAVIGPRPLPENECSDYMGDKKFAKRWSVRPGLFCTVDTELRALADRDTQFRMDVKIGRAHV